MWDGQKLGYEDSDREMIDASNGTGKEVNDSFRPDYDLSHDH